MLLQEKVTSRVNIREPLMFTKRYVIIGNIELELLDEEVLFIKGAYKRVRRWVKGKHPKIGVIIKGFTGFETVIEQDVIVPVRNFYVI
jgi:hypothetical protein